MPNIFVKQLRVLRGMRSWAKRRMIRSGADDEGGTMPKSASELVTEAKGRVENLDPDTVEQELDRGDAVLVDIRESEELATAGRIPGSIHVPRGMLEFRADPSSPYHVEPLDPSRRVILHCASGGRSALAAATLQEMGYTDVAHLDGGITGWKEAGKPTE
jgi:rhodanese-related sulfurtransferase